MNSGESGLRLNQQWDQFSSQLMFFMLYVQMMFCTISCKVNFSSVEVRSKSKAHYMYGEKNISKQRSKAVALYIVKICEK